MASVNLDNVSKSFGSFVAIDKVSAQVEHGEFLVLLGPSGCGKSTILRILAGLEPLSSGRVIIGDEEVNNVEARDRDMAFVFQSYALYPHMTVRRNLSFPLIMREFKPWYHIPGVGAYQIRKMERAPETREKVEAVAASLGIEELLDRRPRTLSGGQRQRVAVGRAMVRNPKVFLMDEPLSNLDANLRVQMRAELSRLHRELKTTFVYVTHDQTEALSLGTSVLVLDHGKMQQFGPPKEIFESPANVFVAQFIGSPPMNIVKVTGRGADGLEVADFKLTLSSEERGALDGAKVGADDLLLGVRPEEVEITEPEHPNTLSAKVVGVENTGSDTVATLQLADERLSWQPPSEGTKGRMRLLEINVRVASSFALQLDQKLGCRFNVGPTILFRRSTGNRIYL